MTKFLVVGLAMALATMGNARGGSQKGDTGQNSSATATTATATTTTTTTTAARPSTSGNVVHSSPVVHSSGNGNVPVLHRYPTTLQNVLPTSRYTNWRLQRPVDRDLSRQPMWVNRSRQNTGTIATTNPNISANDSIVRRHRDGQNVSPNQNATTEARPTGSNNKAIPVTNFRNRAHKPVLNFNNSDTMAFNDACRRHRSNHDCNWWRNHCTTIILVGAGFYAWDLGYWYPAFGYDPYYADYAYDGPIYGYDGLPPDQIIANVQSMLQQLGYFSEAVDGVLGPVTRQAIADYQLDNGLAVTGAIDRPTLVALGFIY